MTDTGEELNKRCKHIKDIVTALAEDDDLRYDINKGILVSKDEIPSDEMGCYQDLRGYLIDDNCGIKIITDLSCNTLFSCRICVTWGGPNIYVDTDCHAVKGYWGFDNVSIIPLDASVCDRIDDMVDREWRCKKWHME